MSTQGDKSPEELRSDIAQTREELGDTVEALAAKTDVKARARERVEELKSTAFAKRDELKSTAFAKRDELTAKVKDATPGGNGGGAAAGGGAGGAPGSASTASSAQVKAKEASQQAMTFARQNPIPVAVAGGVLLGFLVARATGR
jgi:ElaB/YqjD/DUF883 family membrane-anchored ribosome-binding protein